ncbi:DUF748 domain-containing protein [Arcobacteraceae bacterium]|nr:DUF748 domain-containing protein [Arcobacteraceae bacterium]
MKTIWKNTWSRILFIIFMVYSLLGFIILPYLIQSNFTEIIRNTLNTNAYLNRVYINPFTFEVRLHKLLIQDNKNKTLLYFKSLKTDLNLFSLINNEIELDYIYLDSLKTSITLYKDKKLNFSHILTKLNEKTKKQDVKNKEVKESELLFTLNTLHLKNTQFDFFDQTKTKDFEIKTKPFDFKVDNFSTKRNSSAKIATNIEIIDTANFNFSSNLMLSPIRIDGDMSLQDIQLQKIYSYLEDDLKFKFSGLIQNISTTFDINIDNNTTQAKLQKLTINIPNASYKDETYSLNINKLNHSTQNINIKKNNLLDFDLNNIILTSENIEFKDKVRNKNQALNFKYLSIAIDKFSSDTKQKSNILFSLKTPRSGNINGNIDALQEPLSIKGNANIKKIDIVPYKEYIKEFINIDMKKTFLDIDVKLGIKKETQKLDANIKMSDIDLFHNLTQKRLIRIKTFDIKGINYTNNNLSIQNVLLDNFHTSFKIDSNKNTNIDGLIVEKEENKKVIAEEPNKQKNSPFHYYIKNLAITNGHTEFSDHSLPLNFDTKIHNLTATINDLSSKNKEADIKLKGTIDKYGLANIHAKSILSDFKDKTDVSISFENLDVKSFTPYSGKFIGQKIADGRLWLDLNYNISQAKLSSTNNIKIKNLTLGEDVESPEAMSLPVGLAIALLEDSEGLIELDIPVKGDMANPEFELSGVIWKTLGNVITNIVTAPFRFLGSLLGMDSDELGTIEFNFAQAEILPPQKEKLDKLNELFQKKKNLIIVLQPTINIINDSKYLKNIKFESLIKSDDKNAMIEKIYIKRFGEDSLNALSEKNQEDELLTIMSKSIKETISISEQELNTLAYKRVQNIETYLLSHKLTLDRIQINKNVFENKDNDTKELSLKLELNIKD